MLKRLWPSWGGSDAAGKKTTASVKLSPKSKKTMPRWNLNAEEAAHLLLSTPQMSVLDVRTPEEFAAGHLDRAQNIDFFNPQFQDKIALLDKAKPYLLHCASGHRSARAQDILAKLNFTTVYHLDGGIKAWVQAGKPLAK